MSEFYTKVCQDIKRLYAWFGNFSLESLYIALYTICITLVHYRNMG